MTVRIVTRLILLTVALAAATVLMLGALSVLTSAAPAGAALAAATPAAAVERDIEAPAEEGSGSAPTPAVVLVFAGIVLLAALPPVHRVHVYHRSDWL